MLHVRVFVVRKNPGICAGAPWHSSESYGRGCSKAQRSRRHDFQYDSFQKSFYNGAHNGETFQGARF